MSSGLGEMPAFSPYRGFEPFDEDAADYFFGRKRDARLISASLFASGLTLLYGASGVGKSSVLRAGVLPLLRERKGLLPVIFPRLSSAGGGASTVENGWQGDAVNGIKDTVASALLDAFANDPHTRERCQIAIERQENASFAEFLQAVSSAAGKRLMLILDQFEEYFLYHPEHDRFAEQFPQAINLGELPVSFLLSMRDDALAKLDRFKGRIPSLWDSYRRIDHLDWQAARDAIECPIKEYNRQLQSDQHPVEVEPALVEEVLKQVPAGRDEPLSDQPEAEARIETPYLQLVMTRLWERERNGDSHRLRLSTLQDEGGADNIVQTHLDRVMARFTPEEQDLAAKAFRRLVTPSGAKQAMSVSDIAQEDGIPVDSLGRIFRQLEEGNRRILRRVASRSDAGAEQLYEIFHDRLGDKIIHWRTRRQNERELERRLDKVEREKREQAARSAGTQLQRGADLTVVVVAGAGATGAYLAGAMSELIPRIAGANLGSTILLGSGAGAINVALWTAGATPGRNLRNVGADALDFWRQTRRAQFYQGNAFDLLHGYNQGVFAFLRVLTALMPGPLAELYGWVFQPLVLLDRWGTALQGDRASGGVVDTRPLLVTLRKCVDFGRLHENVHSGAVRGVGVFATQTSACNEVALQTTGARLFIDLTTEPEPGALSAVSAAAAPTALAAEHVMASAAIPVLFPAIRIEKPTHLSGLYADGSASPSKPIKTAIDLGASRIIYISGHAHRRRDAADISCDAANVELFELASASLYTQAAAAAAKDIKGLRRVNKMVREAVSAGVTLKSDQDKAYRYVKELLISPGRDCVPSLARSSLTTSVRGRDTAAGSAFSALYRLAYRFSPSGADEILSYLLFDADYLEKQIELGAVDARAALENDTELQSSTA